MAASAQGCLVDDSLGCDAFRAQVFSTVSAKPSMLWAYNSATVFADRLCRVVTESAFAGLVPDHLTGRSLKDLPVGPAPGNQLDGDYRDVQ